MTLNPNSAHRQAALEVLEAVTADEFLLQLLELQGWIPPKPALFNSTRAREITGIGQHMDTLQFAGQNAIARPVTPVWPRESSAVATAVNDIVTRDREPAAGLSDLADRLRSIETEGVA